MCHIIWVYMIYYACVGSAPLSCGQTGISWIQGVKLLVQRSPVAPRAAPKTFTLTCPFIKQIMEAPWNLFGKIKSSFNTSVYCCTWEEGAHTAQFKADSDFRPLLRRTLTSAGAVRSERLAKQCCLMPNTVKSPKIIPSSCAVFMPHRPHRTPPYMFKILALILYLLHPNCLLLWWNLSISSL